MFGTGIAAKLGLASYVDLVQRWPIFVNERLNSFRQKQRVRKRGKTKVFVIGFNKTGTTSMAAALHELGYIVGDQHKAELLFEGVANGRYKKLIEYCRTAEAFQDIPFSLPHVYRHLDKAFPGSKFILTIRDSGDVWFNSMVKFHSKLFGNGKIPTAEDLKNARYRYKGFAYKVQEFLFGEPFYHHEKYIYVYTKHIEDVKVYFQSRKKDLLVLNVGEPNSYEILCEFLGFTKIKTDFPWENRTNKIKVQN